MNALLNLAHRKVVPHARTRYNILPEQSQGVSTPRSILLGTYTTRGCGVTKATSNSDMLDVVRALA
eukprot:5332738-Prorocentrum_lima.AAC.1